MEHPIASPVALKRTRYPYLRRIAYLAGGLLIVGLLLRWTGHTPAGVITVAFWNSLLTRDFLIYLLVGFVAQMIDGSLGMAYGVSSTSFLMSTGVSPAVASASVHVSEVITTGISGLSHWKLGNVDRQLFKKLVVPGALGAALGAFVLTSFDGHTIKPYVSAYLLVMGIIIISKACRRVMVFRETPRMQWLALVGGFIDASGGGGWGPVVTSTLMSSGKHPRLTIGTVNAAEFLVALTTSGVFTLLMGVHNWPVIAGLMVGGAVAAPLGAYCCRKINVRLAMVLVGLVIIILSARTLLLSFGWL